MANEVHVVSDHIKNDCSKKKLRLFGALERMDAVHKETLESLLLIRRFSEAYCAPQHRFSLNKVGDATYGRNVASDTPWDLVVKKFGGGYAAAIITAMRLLTHEYPDVQKLTYTHKYYEDDEESLTELIALLSDLSPSDFDLFELYEYFLIKKFTVKSTLNGDFFTSKSIVQCIGTLLNPDGGSLYDPCCGSGSLLAGIAHIMPNAANSRLYGQTQDQESYRICLMNALLHGMDVDLGKRPANTLIDDQHCNQTFDYIVTNPPFNVSNWDEGCHVEKWHYGVPPRSNANFAWLQHIISHMKEGGRACVILPNGTLTSQTNEENTIREAIVRDGIVEAIITFPPGLFYSTTIPFCVWLLNRSHQVRDNILIIDAVKLGITKKNITETVGLMEELLTKYREGELDGRTESYSVTPLEKIAQNEYVLSPNWYTAIEYNKASEIRLKLPRLEKCIDILSNTLRDETLRTHIEQWKQNSVALSWKKELLTDLYEVFGGISKPGDMFGHGRPLVDVKTIIHNMFVPDTVDSCVEVTEFEACKYSIRYGDVLLNRTSESNEEIACCCVAAKDSTAVYTGYAKRLRPQNMDILYPPYAAGYFCSAAYRREIDKVSTVFMSRASMNTKKLKKVFVYYPEESVQRAIGDTLTAIHVYLQNNTDEGGLLAQFAELLIEQHITYPVTLIREQEESKV
jgi:type I restriction enzyme M protein